MIITVISVLFFGAILGSFLNVVILRLNTGRSMVKGRSRCSRCDRTLSWYELIPILSFIGLRGKCRTCKREISFQYPFIEILTALLFFGLYMQIIATEGTTAVSIGTFAAAVLVMSTLVVIGVYDLRHKIIPNVAAYTLIALGLITSSINIWYLGEGAPIDFLAGPALALPFFLIWFFSQGRAMGFGDVKLALGIGWLLALSQVVPVFFFAFFIGAIVGLILLAGTKKYGLKSEVPFAPFLIVAYTLVTLFGLQLPLFSFYV